MLIVIACSIKIQILDCKNKKKLYFFINSYIYILQIFTITLHIQDEVVLCLKTAGSTEGMEWWSSLGDVTFRTCPRLTDLSRGGR